jgi:hypothetical protein
MLKKTTIKEILKENSETPYELDDIMEMINSRKFKCELELLEFLGARSDRIFKLLDSEFQNGRSAENLEYFVKNNLWHVENVMKNRSFIVTFFEISEACFLKTSAIRKLKNIDKGNLFNIAIAEGFDQSLKIPGHVSRLEIAQMFASFYEFGFRFIFHPCCSSRNESSNINNPCYSSRNELSNINQWFLVTKPHNVPYPIHYDSNKL